MNVRVRLLILLAGVALFMGAKSSPSLLTSQQILQLVNSDRISHGLPPLNNNPELDLAAYAKAKDMVDKDYFAHTSPDGVQPWHWFTALGYRYAYAGENLAEGYSDAQDLETSWMSSPTHRANILSPFYSDEGVAVVNEKNTTIVIQFFGSKDSKLTLGNSSKQ